MSRPSGGEPDRPVRRDRLTCAGARRRTAPSRYTEPSRGDAPCCPAPHRERHPPIMNIRRCAAALAAVAVIGIPGSPAFAASPSPSGKAALPDGLYGSTDPKYDGVWRQSLALLAQHTAGVRPAARAVDWLTGQQCADGSYAAFRADPARACDAKVMVDTNSTAAAVQALAALGGH
ncbi:secreted protein, partial [Streptomyces sp. e14]